jgi:hypothetical protein
MNPSDPVRDGCEWNPDEDRPSCAALRFGRFCTRRIITRRPPDEAQP